jgi:aerobic carbon-monoxide dehydrogenase large subunit
MSSGAVPKRALGVEMPTHGVGASVRRKEDERFLRGKGLYVADFFLPQMREVAFVRSTVAHGRIVSIEIPEEFRQVVFTAKDLAAVKPLCDIPSAPGFKASEEPVIAGDKVRFVGEIVAMCVAGSRAEAEDIASTVVVNYDELQPIVDMLTGRNETSVRVHEHWEDNVFVEFNEERADEALIKNAAIKVSREIRTSRQCMFPMEGRGVMASWDHHLGLLTLVTSTQIPGTIQTGLAEALGLDHGSIRIIAPDVGGGFGYKCVLSREEIAVAWFSKTTGYPAQWLEDCREHLSANSNCREHHYRITGYATAEGKLLGIDCDALVDAGAYSSYPVSAGLEAAQVVNILPGPYDFSSYRCRAAAVATNKPPILAYRGVARPGVCLAIELVMDAIARETKLEPYEVRLRNLVRPEQMPFNNVVMKHFDSGDYPECLRRAVKAIGVAEIRKRQQSKEPDGRLIGVGIAFFCEQGAHGTSVLASWGRPVVPGFEQAAMRLTPDGGIEIRVGTHSHGQGHETTYAQIAHEILGVQFDKIRVLQGDTLYMPYSTGTWGSRSIVMAGGAIARCSRELAARAVQIGAWLLQADPGSASISNGEVISGNASVSLREVARAWYLQPQHLPPHVNVGGLDATVGYRADRDSGTFSYAAHAALVAVDPETGLTEILDYVVVEDGGVLINPKIVDGQIYGGTAQGIGTALYEEVPFDSQGQPLASTMIDYMLPGSAEIPDIRVFHMETPSPYTEFGVKGIGEGGAVGPPAAILCAVNDALRATGAELSNVPLRPRDIVNAINKTSGRSSKMHASEKQ